MNEAWLQEEILEEVLEFASVPSGVWFLTGDSMVTVNKSGHRVYDETHVYNERTRVHSTWDPQAGEYPNLFSSTTSAWQTSTPEEAAPCRRRTPRRRT